MSRAAAMDAGHFEEAKRAPAPKDPNALELFGGKGTGIQWPAPSKPTATSEAAADALTHTHAGRVKRETQLIRLLRLIASRESGYTIDELEVATGLGTGTICARVIYDLKPKGLVETSETIRRRTRRGKDAAVHFATPKGRELLAR